MLHSHYYYHYSWPNAIEHKFIVATHVNWRYLLSGISCQRCHMEPCPGSHRLRIGKDMREVCEKWVSEAEVIEEETHQTWPIYKADVSETYKGTKGNCCFRLSKC